MMEITNKNDLKQYLYDKNIVNKETKVDFQVLVGGVSGDVIKVITPNKTMVIKQALAKLKVKDDWFSDPTRIITEKNCLNVYNKIIPDSVPELYFFDDSNYLYGMECAPPEAIMWKTDLLAKKLDFDIAKQVISSLLKVHTLTSSDKEIQKIFKDKKTFYELRIEPYFETVLKKHPQLSEPINRCITIAMTQEIALIHGDFSPKNILVNHGRIFILDFEVAHFGAPSFDLAFFANHFLLKAIKNKDIHESYLNMLTYMMNIYFDGNTIMDSTQLEADTVLMLASLFIARVDGKSPAEYITEDLDKQLIRDIAYKILLENMTTFKQVINILKKSLTN